MATEPLASPSSSAAPPTTRKRYVPAVGPRLRVLLVIVFVLTALLGANSAYLVGVTVLETLAGPNYQNYFYQYMFMAHLVLGLLLVVPFLAFVAAHLANTRLRKNRRAVKVGYALLTACLVVLVSGVLLMRFDALSLLQLRSPAGRSVAYWAHVLSPLVVLWLYWLHRLAGPRIKWKLGLAYAGAVGAACAAMLALHSVDPRTWNPRESAEGEKYFFPSLARTSNGKLMPPETLMNDGYCKECHADVHADWLNSAHRFSSFNNPVYLASVRETREFSRKQESDGSVRRARWCAGCHDPVPFFSGAFDDPRYDDVADPTAREGITCVSCHSITHVNSTRGNADYVIEEPLHYPFTYSDNPLLMWVNRQLIKAKPDFHKRTFLKPVHKTAEFCSTCHKVHLPEALNDYKWLRGQDHYGTFLMSGVSGHNARAFYYPPKARENCASCHMPLKASDDFGAKFFADGATGTPVEQLSVHSHLFPAANTGIAWLRDRPDLIAAHQAYLKDVARVDVFGLRPGGTVDGSLIAPLRPQVPPLEAGQRYVFDVVVRTLKLGHLLTQGTVDSNELWLDVTVKSGDRVIGKSGGIDDGLSVDPWSHFINVFMLDKHGNRIDRRNPQDIFIPLYNNQIPPGAAATMHYALELPDKTKLAGPVTVEVKLQYRKFDVKLMDFVTRAAKPGDVAIRGHQPGKPYRNELPVTTIAADSVTFAVAGDTAAVTNAAVTTAPWERWNDYGIGLLRKEKAMLRQAAVAFTEVEKLGRYDGPLNLARVHVEEGELDRAVEALKRAIRHFQEPPAPPWTVAWLTGVVNRQQGHLTEAAANFRSVLEDKWPVAVERGYDFSIDIEVLNALGEVLFDLGKKAHGQGRAGEADAYFRQATETFEKTLAIDREDVAAHYNLMLLYERVADTQKAAEHRKHHARYKPDDNARDHAFAEARQRYPAANHATERVVIYPLQRAGAPGLPVANAVKSRDGQAGQ